MQKRLTLLFFGLVILLGQINCAIAQSMTHATNQKVIRVIEYYDYTCPHCRNMSAVLDRLQKNYPHAKLIYHPVPVLHSDSRVIASVILVSVKRQKNLLHHEVLSLKGVLDIHQVLAMAQHAGFQAEDLLQQAKMPAIQAELDNNIHLAEHYSEEGIIRLPILVLETAPSNQPPFILRGEQSYALLAAIVEQLGGPHVSMVKESI